MSPSEAGADLEGPAGELSPNSEGFCAFQGLKFANKSGRLGFFFEPIDFENVIGMRVGDENAGKGEVFRLQKI